MHVDGLAQIKVRAGPGLSLHVRVARAITYISHVIEPNRHWETICLAKPIYHEQITARIKWTNPRSKAGDSVSVLGADFPKGYEQKRPASLARTDSESRALTEPRPLHVLADNQ